MEAINKIEKELRGRTLALNSIKKDKTVFIVMDMVNGFVYNGALSSPRVASIVGNIVKLNEKTKGYKKIFFKDCHNEDAIEFKSFPPHCIRDTDESEIISELKTEASEGDDTVYIEKNSTNAFMSQGFQKWMSSNLDETDNYIVTGCVTDICIMQFALALKGYFNENNLEKRIILPIDSVDTYDLGSHDGSLMNLVSLYIMHTAGIEVVDNVN